MLQNYELRIYNDTLITFSLEKRGLEGLSADIISIADDKKQLFPIDLTLTPHSILKWLEKRVIPKNRMFVNEILKTLGLSANDTQGIIDVSKGLSLNDSIITRNRRLVGRWNMLEKIIELTNEYIESMPKKERKKYGQFFTSMETARFMVGLYNFDEKTGKVSVNAAFNEYDVLLKLGQRKDIVKDRYAG